MNKKILLFLTIIPLLLFACSSEGNEQTAEGNGEPVIEVFRAPT